MKYKFNQVLLQVQLEIQEQVLRTICQQIHENIGQVLSLAKLQLNSMQGCITNADLLPTKNLISKSITDLRDLSKSLHYERIAELGLLESIQQELHLVQLTYFVKTKFEVTGSMQRLSTEKEMIVFRIFQDLMHSLIKQSKASTLQVTLLYDPECLVLLLSGHGKRLNKEMFMHIGLSSMQSRAVMIHAELTIESMLSKGATAMLKVPF